MIRPGWTPGNNSVPPRFYQSAGLPTPDWAWYALAANLWEDDAATDPAEDTDGVAVWTGSTRDLIQTTGGNRPTYDQANNAVSFGAGQNLTCSDTGMPTGSNTRSVAFWAYPTVVDGNYHFPFKYGNVSLYEAHFITINTGSNKWSISNFGEVVEGSVAVVDTWAHVCSTFDGTTHKIYVDGAEAGSGTMTDSLSLGDGVNLGSILGTDYSGLLDAALIYSVCLTPGEVADLFALGR